MYQYFILYLRMFTVYLKLTVYSRHKFYLFILVAVEKTRVKLKREDRNDYINANHVKVVRKADISNCIYIAHFLYGYIQMHFTTPCGRLLPDCFMAQLQSFNVTSRIHRCPQNRMSDFRPQHREPHALLFTHSVWVL